MLETYVFNGDAVDFFYEKLDSLHEKYVDGLILNGVAPKGTDLQSIKMSKSPDVNKKYCRRVVGGLVNIKPSILARFVEDGRTRIECIFTKICDQEHINNVYLIQNVMDWPEIGHFSCQIWYLGKTRMNQINQHWN